MFEPKALEITAPVKQREVPFKMVTDLPVSELYKPVPTKRTGQLLTPVEALTKAKRLLTVMSNQQACREMGFGKNYLYSLKSKYPELWSEIIGN